MADAVTIAREAPDQPPVRELLAEADAYYAGLYPPDKNHLLDVASLGGSEVRFFVARLDGTVAAFGALIDRGGWGEIKRMYTAPRWRGRSLGRMILATLEDAAREAGLAVLRLETGDKQQAAIALYEAAGYRRCDAFGGYPDVRDSLFFEKHL